MSTTKTPMSGEEQRRERARGQKWAKSLSDRDVSDFVDQQVLGDFDWRDWFEKKQSSAFINGAFDEAQYREEMRRPNPEIFPASVYGRNSRDVAEALRCVVLFRAGKRCNVPSPGESIVWDKLYKRLEDEKLLKWHHVHPGFASLSDHYVLTADGKKALADYAARSNPRRRASTRRR